MNYETNDSVPQLYLKFCERLGTLRNHLNKYMFVLFRKNEEPVYFNCADISRIAFCDTGFEIILKDSGTMYFVYDNILEFSLLLIASTTQNV